MSFEAPGSIGSGGDDDVAVVSSRVVGLPGEVIEFEGGQVVVDGDPTVDIWATSSIAERRVGGGRVVLDDDEYFMLADNRAWSQDSRFYGPVAREDIQLVGKLDPARDGGASSECQVSDR